MQIMEVVRKIVIIIQFLLLIWQITTDITLPLSELVCWDAIPIYKFVMVPNF